MKKILTLCLLCFTSFVFAAAPKTPEKLTVILDWFPNPNHAPLIIAAQKGFFKEEGLEVKLIGPSDPTDPPKWIAAKKADIGITYEPELMEQIDRGLPLIRVGTLIDKPLNCMVVLKDSGIKNLADLKGKHIGSSSGGLSSVMIKAVLTNEGLSNKDVDLINVRYNLSQALLSHKVDAVTGMMRNFEVPQLELTNHKVIAFFPEEHGVPNYSELVFITHLDNVKDKRIPHFMAALKKAVAYLDEHPEETWLQFIKQYPEANNPVNREAWFTTMPYFAENPSEFDFEDWQRFAKFLKQNHLIKKIQPISRYAVMV